MRIILSETSHYQQEDNTLHTETLIPTLKKNARQSQESKMHETTSALEPQKHINKTREQ